LEQGSPSTEPFGEAQDRLRAGAGVEDESCREAAERVQASRGPEERGSKGVEVGYEPNGLFTLSKGNRRH